MAISDRTRKMLWGRAAGRCALCNRELVIDAPAGNDREALVGDECHIVAQRPGGPRAGEQLPPGVGPDDYGSLILLCRIDHKRVDDQPAHFTSERLRQIKAGHERRVAPTAGGLPELRVVEDPEDTGPMLLRLVTSGRQLWDIAARTHVWNVHHPDPVNEDESDLLGRFFSNLSDWVDIQDSLNPGDVVRVAFGLGEDLDELAHHGFALYAGRRRRFLTGGIGGPSPWWETWLRIVRMTPVDAPTGDS